jgi:alkylation response protein AidB-like acyl-CoA dehydrogenase
MDLMPSAEHDDIVDTVRSFLSARIPVTGRGHGHVTDGPELDPALWYECAELGWLGLGLPESAGGVGYGLVEEMLLFRELGRGVVPGHFLPGVLGAHVAAAAGDLDLATSIVSGDVLVALGTTVGPTNIGRSVTGELSVVHSDRAELVVVCNEHVASLIRLADCAIGPVDPVEGSVSVGRGRADVVDAVAWITAATDPVFLRGLVLAAAAATGVAEAALALAVQHAGQRIQFGRPIGVNQAIKHWCADMAVSAEGAFAQSCYAAVAVRDGLPEAATEASIAKYHADEAARRNSEGCVQIHGAMGFTSEAVPHRYVSRAHLLGRCLATRPNLLDRIVQR